MCVWLAGMVTQNEATKTNTETVLPKVSGGAKFATAKHAFGGLSREVRNKSTPDQSHFHDRLSSC